MIRLSPVRIAVGAGLLAALAVIPYCTQNARNQVAIDRVHADAGAAMDAAARAQRSADEAAAAARAAHHAADNVAPPEGPGS